MICLLLLLRGRSLLFLLFFVLGCSSSYFFCQPTISIIINEEKKRTKKLTMNLKITKYYDLSLVYKKGNLLFFFYTLFLKLRRATHESRAEDACQLVDKSCVCICVTSQFSFFLSKDKKETRTWHTVSLIISWTLFSQTYLIFFVFLFFYLRILLKWTTHLDVRAVSNLLYSFTIFFLAAPFFSLLMQQCLPSVVARPASNFLCVCTQFAFR